MSKEKEIDKLKEIITDLRVTQDTEKAISVALKVVSNVTAFEEALKEKRFYADCIVLEDISDMLLNCPDRFKTLGDLRNAINQTDDREYHHMDIYGKYVDYEQGADGEYYDCGCDDLEEAICNYAEVELGEKLERN